MGKIAVKAMQRNGTDINVNGIVYNKDGNEITRFNTEIRGMGQFVLAPKENVSYYAVCTNDKGQSKRFELPVAKDSGYALSASWNKDKLMVKALQPEGQKTDDYLYLIVHTRGVVQDARIIENTNETIVLPKEFFPSGVSNLLLLNKNMDPLSERLVFVSIDDQANVECKTDKEVYSPRSPVDFTANITDESGIPLQGNISVSVTDDRAVSVDTTFNILTSLLLTSDLRGNISDPSFYFQKDNRSLYAQELLMLTQGWRRYDTERIVKNDLLYPDTLLEIGSEISGTVRKSQTFTKAKPEVNANVSLLSLSGDFFENMLTDINIGGLMVSDIARVDVLTSAINLAAFGNEGECGVIAIYTRKGKSNAAKERLYIKKIMPLGFQKPIEFYAPKYDSPDQQIKLDFRTTIHWQPNLMTNENGVASFSFYTAATPSTYSIVIEGVTDDGKIIYKRDKITVEMK